MNPLGAWELFQRAREAGWSPGELTILGALLVQMAVLGWRLRRVERRQEETEKKLAKVVEVTGLTWSEPAVNRVRKAR